MTAAADEFVIYDAAAAGDVEAVLAAAARGQRIDDSDPQQDDRTPLHIAAENGHAAVVAALHRLGSTAIDRSNNYGATPMHAAAYGGHVHVVETLHRLGCATLDQANDYGTTPMHAAAFKGQVAVVRALHRLGSTALDRPNLFGQTPMHIAVEYNHLALVDALIKLGSTVPHRRADVLDAAFKYQHTAMAELLLAAGVDAAALEDDWPDQVRNLLATPVDRLLALRRQLYFSSTLLDLLFVCL